MQSGVQRQCLRIASVSCLFLWHCSQALTLHVAVDGADAGDGSAAAPFASIQRAQQAVRELKADGGLTESVTVLIRPGVYRQTESLRFEPADSGTPAHPITWRGTGPGVVVSGGRRITGFRMAGQRWRADVAGVSRDGRQFNTLYVNGQRRPRARTPNEGRYFRILSPLPEGQGDRRGFYFRSGDVEPWSDWSQALFVVFGSWYNTHHHVAGINHGAHTVTFTNRAGRPFSWYEKNLRYYVENVASALDAPGEWHLDVTAGTLTYHPLPGETPAATEVVAPVVSQVLLRLAGVPGDGPYVEHIRFEDLVFRHTDAHLPRDLYDARQAATVQDAGIQADGVRHCSFARCEVANMGEHGIWLRDDCHGNTVRQCHVHDLGGGGIYVGEKWRWGNDTPGWRGCKNIADVPHTTERNVVDNCFVHDGCALFAGAVGIWIGQASFTTVTHNDICDMSYTGISAGWDWSGNPSTCHDNLIAENHIHHLGHGRMNDMAGIYTLGRSPGTVLRQNLIHDIDAYQSPVGYCLGAGIYLDQSSGFLTIEENVCYGIRNAGFFLHYGKGNRLRNNVFAELEGLGRLGWGMCFTSREGSDDDGNAATHNILMAYAGRAVKAYQRPWRGKTGKPYPFIDIDRNFYAAADGMPPQFAAAHEVDAADLLGMAAWQQTGHDANSATGDPGFVDPVAHDYRLKPDAAARALGIASVDVSDAGLYGDPAWTALPKGVRFRPVEKTVPFEPSGILMLEEDYEDMPVGASPIGANFMDSERGAVVAVTDRHAVSGKHALCFVDVPGLPQSYHPIRVWRDLRVAEGVVTVAFDCLNSAEKPATFQVELRDWRSKPGYEVGPTLLFEPTGHLRVGQEQLPFAPGEWHRVEVRFELGPDAPSAFRFLFGRRGQEMSERTVPFQDAAFEVLTWLGFISTDADRHAEFFIDNLTIATGAAAR